jgi:hypothetical protein
MIKVYYVKFYQAVQVGKDLLSYLGGDQPKIKDLEMTYEHGLLKVVVPKYKTVYVPFSNIMYFHEVEVKVKKGA